MPILALKRLFFLLVPSGSNFAGTRGDRRRERRDEPAERVNMHTFPFRRSEKSFVSYPIDAVPGGGGRKLPGGVCANPARGE